jgi:hypothetical protein
MKIIFFFLILLLIVGCKTPHYTRECEIECPDGYIEGTCECKLNLDDIFIDDDTIEPPGIPNEKD